MAQARVVAARAARVFVVAPAIELGGAVVAALAARGIEARVATRTDEPAADPDAVLAWALEAAPSPVEAVELAQHCARAAGAGRPVCVLAPAARRGGNRRHAIDDAAALAQLRAHGAAITHDVDVWLEAMTMLVWFGVPAGPRTAIVAPPGSWLGAQAAALVTDAELAGARAPFAAAGDDAPVDVVLYDPALGAPSRATPGMHVPVAARHELATRSLALQGARPALGAITILGRAAERIAIGLGPAPRTASAELGIDREKLARQVPRLGNAPRIGDHDTKALLSAYGVAITRQAVATTPSAAVKLARRAGYPVELKPYGNDLPTEPGGCPVEHGVDSDALVRSAYAAVLAAAGRTHDGAAVIVRETPPAGREVAISISQLPALGWVVVLDAPGSPQLAAAPAPLRLLDAQDLAAHVSASRAGDPDVDRAGLANLLRRASHVVVDLEATIAELELARVIVGGRGARTVVVDASLTLR
jgi:hypothetical protein